MQADRYWTKAPQGVRATGISRRSAALGRFFWTLVCILALSYPGEPPYCAADDDLRERLTEREESDFHGDKEAICKSQFRRYSAVRESANPRLSYKMINEPKALTSVLKMSYGAAIRSRGFTLLELLVVMVIIGLLVGYVGPRFFAQVGKSEVKAARAQLNAFEKALDQYRLDTGHYPTSEQGLAALMARPGNEPKWDGPYLKKSVPPDPWGKPYLYRAPGEHGEYDLVSYGSDGQPGGSGEGADITNWQ